ncbi:MAG: DNRLRE domain-containing protein [Deltaproteobacteria bacterium]|nr:DNRLRE domain-containing protein [Deltaproteobacteria bacterium]
MARSEFARVALACLILAAASPAAAGTYTFTPTADAQVLSDFPMTNYATGTRMAVDGAPYAQQTLLRFTASGLSGTVTSAKVRVYVNNPSDDGPAIYRVGTTWTESSVTWNSRPALVGSALADKGVIATATWAEYDVTAAITVDGSYNFALVSGSADGATFHSRETAERPQLVIVTSTSAPPPPPPPTEPPPPTTTTSVDVTLTPRAGYTGTQRVSFAVPLAKGVLFDPDRVRVLKGGTEISAGRRELAVYPDGSLRSVQIQVQTSVVSGTVLQVRIGETPTTAALSLVAVSTTLEPADGTLGPKVWALLPASWLSASGVAGPQVPEAVTQGTSLDAFDNVCDYQNHTVTQFLSLQTSKDVWLYDRGTAMYRGYARRGDLVTLESGYRETAIYRAGLTGTGTSTRIAVPSSGDDLKYHYAQNLAIHYLLTGDDRFREAAEDVAERVASLWSSPGYAGGADFWTERHAGFALLAYVWARIVTDDQGAQLEALANTAVSAYLAMQAQYPTTWTDSAARCFAHTADSHGESYGTWGCSPWMSAILAEALDVYATEAGTLAAGARSAIIKLGKIVARDGRDGTGKPLYWLGVGSASDVTDPYDEHWGEPAYLVALAWHLGGRTDTQLETAARAMLEGLRTKGSSPHMRSFNWQCRAAVATPYYLR